MSWKKVKLGEFLKQYRVEHLVNDKTTYKQVSILNNGSVVLRGEKIGKEIGRKRQFKIDTQKYPNTLIFTRQLLLQGSIGVASNDVNDCIVTENMPMFSIDTTKIDKEFLILFLKSEVFKSRIREIELTGSAQKSIHERTFLNLEFLLPPFEVQKSMVEEILKIKSDSDNIANELTHQLTLVKSLRQQLLQDAVQGKLVPQHPDDEPASVLLEKIKAEKEKLIAEKKIKKEKPLPPIKPEEIPFEVPEGWVWCRLGEIALHSEAGKSYQALDITSETNQIGVIKTSAITSGFFLENENKLLPNQNINIDKIKIEKGDFLFCRASGSKGLAGKSCLVEQTPKAQLVLSDKSIRYILSTNINKKFLQNVNSSAYGEEYYMNLGTKKSTTMNNITRDQFNSFPIPLPPLSEQTRIVQKLEALMQYCDGLEAGIRESMAQNERLLQQVLREALRG